ncbi:MAG: hypothetical protein WA667_06145 [Candidatus Nitrosopolaris sp.]
MIENRTVPVIGAGFSCNAELQSGTPEMPLWNDVGKHFAEQMKGLWEDYDETNPLEVISGFCQQFSRSTAIEQLQNILHVDNSYPGPVDLSFAELPFDIIITTNFDFLLERACDGKGKPWNKGLCTCVQLHKI